MNLLSLFAITTLLILPAHGGIQCPEDVPDFARQDCTTPNGCAGSSILTVGNGGKPASVTTNSALETTTICYDLSFTSNTSDRCGGDKPLSGISFIVDECCPSRASSTEFFYSVSVTAPSFNLSVTKAQCVEGNPTVAFDNQCTQTKRPCQSDRSKMCSVLNLNDLSLQPNEPVQYCVSVYGTKFDVVSPPNELDPRVEGNAKFCFERGSGGSKNVCSCIDVSFVKSKDLCESSICTAPPSVPHDRACKRSCNSTSKWNISFVDKIFLNRTNRTTFVYAVSSNDSKRRRRRMGTWSSRSESNSKSESGSGRKREHKTKRKRDGKRDRNRKRKPCKFSLEEWSLRVDSCCGKGVLEQAVRSGRVELRLNNQSCPPSVCKVQNDIENGDTITIKHTNRDGQPNIFSISLPGDVRSSSSGSVCGKGNSSSICSCQQIQTPNLCDFSPPIISTVLVTSDFHDIIIDCFDSQSCGERGRRPSGDYSFTWDEAGQMTIKRPPPLHNRDCVCLLEPDVEKNCCSFATFKAYALAFGAGSIANVHVGGNGLVSYLDRSGEEYCVPGNNGRYNFVWKGCVLNITMPNGKREIVPLTDPDQVTQQGNFTISWDIVK